MKPTSIIFLIVSVALVIGGLTVVGISKQMAASEGIDILSEVTENTEEYVYTYEYDADSIGKITIDIQDAKVNVIGGAAKPYVELVNFAQGNYEFSSANRNLMISNNSDLSTLAGIASAAMNFKGLRGLVNMYYLNGLEKTINIYLCDENPVKVLDCRLGVGTVDIRESQTATDYNVEIGEGELIVSGVSTKSALNATIENGNVQITDSLIAKVKIDIENGSVDANSKINQLEAKIENGDFEYSTNYGIIMYNLILSANVGNITIDGEVQDGSLDISNRPTSDKLDINVGNGDIILKSLS